MLLDAATKQKRVCESYENLKLHHGYCHSEAMVAVMKRFNIITQTEFNTYLQQGGVIV